MPKQESKLVYVTDQDPGFSRIKRDKGFIYVDEKKLELSQKKIISRIEKLVIPPIWKEVWICKKENGHLQSTGRDLRNRKQYIYHPEWAALNQQHKFDRIRQFGLALPKLRNQIEEDLSIKKWSKKKVLALILHLLDEYFLRIGNKYYTDNNETYGLTTLRRKHIDDSSKLIKLEYEAKSNKIRKINIDNKRLAKLVREISELPGYEIFRYKDEDGNWQNIDSADVNEYINHITKEDFTAKDFRTWGGTKLTIENYEKAKEMIAENPRLKFETTLVKLVAKRLGNTVSTARSYYIHPDVLALATQHKLPNKIPKVYQSLALETSEKIVLTMLHK